MTDPHTETIAGHHFRLLPVPGGAFLMGSPEGEEDADDDEMPRHEVTVSGFYIGEFPVTQALWRAVVQADAGALPADHLALALELSPSNFQGDDLPLEQVSWDDVRAWIEKLNALTLGIRPAGYHYRLPTEAEWEYTARGGPYWEEGYKYAGSDRLKDVGWFEENDDFETKPVGLKYPNQLGLYDMSGNVWEWCEDAWHGNYADAPADGSAWVDGPERGSLRVIRGGSWFSSAQFCRVARRYNDGPGSRGRHLGFRLVLALQSVGHLPAIP